MWWAAAVLGAGRMREQGQDEGHGGRRRRRWRWPVLVAGQGDDHVVLVPQVAEGVVVGEGQGRRQAAMGHLAQVVGVAPVFVTVLGRAQHTVCITQGRGKGVSSLF